MKEALFREVSQDYLVPLFSGAKLLDQSDQSSVRDKNVGFLDPVSIAFKVKKSDDYRLVLTRPQPFAKESSDIVREIAVVRAFVEVIALMADALATKFKI